MSAPAAFDPRPLARWRAWRIRLVGFACVAVFLWGVARFYSPATGFTSLISIGDALDGRKVSALQAVPHHVYESSDGYDGAYYVQIALNPTLRNPELKNAIDNLPYRARRILFCWVAWVIGLGQPAWVVQAHALLNVGCWLALAWVLTRWFPLTDGQNLLRWFGVLFSSGVCMSVRNSLVDAPALLLVAMAMAAFERGRRGPAIAGFALAGLGRETNLLALAGLAEPGGGEPRRWRRLAGQVALAVLPLAAWMGFLFGRFGSTNDSGLRNFTVPLGGMAEKWGETLSEFSVHDSSPLRVTTLAALLALTVQWIFFAVRWRPAEAWWRVGAAYAALTMFLARPVWEGYPGAAPRVLLPMLLAFNISVPRGWRWLPLLIAGNLGVLVSYREVSPPREFFEVRGEAHAVAALQVERVGGWLGLESSPTTRWRWSSGQAGFRLRNLSAGPVTAIVRGQIGSALDRRRVRAFAGEAMVWSGEVTSPPGEFSFGCRLPPGETVLMFRTDLPAHHVGADDRPLAFRVLNLEIVAKAAPGKVP